MLYKLLYYIYIYIKVLVIDPTNSLAQHGLALTEYSMLSARGDASTACHAFETVLKSNPWASHLFPSYRELLGMVKASTKKEEGEEKEVVDDGGDEIYWPTFEEDKGGLATVSVKPKKKKDLPKGDNGFLK
jgi:hypothetical protein